MPTPPLDESTELALFDSFVKKVVRNTAIKIINKAKKENQIVPDEAYISECTTEDTHFSENIICDRFGHEWLLVDVYLYEAMLLLKEEQIEVLIMEFQYGMHIWEIAKKLHISERAVYARKKKTFDSIRKNYKGEYNEKPYC